MIRTEDVERAVGRNNGALRRRRRPLECSVHLLIGEPSWHAVDIYLRLSHGVLRGSTSFFGG